MNNRPDGVALLATDSWQVRFWPDGGVEMMEYDDGYRGDGRGRTPHARRLLSLAARIAALLPPREGAPEQEGA